MPTPSFPPFCAIRKGALAERRISLPPVLSNSAFPLRKREARCAPFFLLPVSQSLSLDCDTVLFSSLVLTNSISLISAQAQKVRSFRCSSSPQQTRFAGLCWGPLFQTPFLRPAASGRSHPFRCASFSHKVNDFVGALLRRWYACGIVRSPRGIATAAAASRQCHSTYGRCCHRLCRRQIPCDKRRELGQKFSTLCCRLPAQTCHRQLCRRYRGETNRSTPVWLGVVIHDALFRKRGEHFQYPFRKDKVIYGDLSFGGQDGQPWSRALRRGCCGLSELFPDAQRV